MQVSGTLDSDVFLRTQTRADLVRVSSNPYLVQVILGAVNVGSTLPGLWAVEKLGRRQTLFIGSAIMFTGQIVVGALGTAYPQGEVAGKIIIAFSCIFIL